MKIEELMKYYNPFVLIDIMFKDKCIGTSTSINIAKIYAKSTIDHLDVVHTTSGVGRFTVWLNEAYQYGEKIT